MLTTSMTEGHLSGWKIPPAFSQFSSQNAVWRCPSMPGLWQLFPPALWQPNRRILHPDFWSISSPELILGSSPECCFSQTCSRAQGSEQNEAWLLTWHQAATWPPQLGTGFFFFNFYLLSKRNGYQSQLICAFLSVCSHSSEKLLSIPADDDFQLKQAQCMRQNQGWETNFWWGWAAMGVSPRVHPWSRTTHRVPSKGDEDHPWKQIKVFSMFIYILGYKDLHLCKIFPYLALVKLWDLVLSLTILYDILFQGVALFSL